MKAPLIICAISLLAAVSIFIGFSKSPTKVISIDTYQEVDSIYHEKQCARVNFAAYQNICNAKTFCQPGLDCRDGKCQVEKSLGETCKFDSECYRQGFKSVTCIQGTCRPLKGPGEVCSSKTECFTGDCVNSKCKHSEIVKDVMVAKTIYCSKYLNSMQSVKHCMNHFCGDSGNRFGYFLDSIDSCVYKNCHRTIKTMTDAAYNEFGVVFTKNGGAVNDQREHVMAIDSVQDILQGCPITASTVSSDFGPSGADLIFEFSNALSSDTLTKTDPALFFSNVTSLGTGASVNFITASKMQVVLGTFPSILPGSGLEFLPTALAVAPACGNYVTGTPIISGRHLRTSISYVIEGPNRVRAGCTIGATIQIITEPGVFTYEWVLDTDSRYIQSVNITNSLAALSMNANRFFVDPEIIANLPIGTLKFNIDVLNRFGLEVKKSFLLDITDQAAPPLCSWTNLPLSGVWNSVVENRLTPKIDLPSCSSGASIVLSGKFFDGPQPTLSGNTVVYAQNAIPHRGEVTIQLDFSVQQNFVEVGNCTLVAKITSERPAPVARFVGGSDVTFTDVNSGNIVIDASASSDSSGLPGTYAFSVCKVDTNTGLCDSGAGITSWPTVSSQALSKFTAVPASAAESLGKFIFSLNYTVDGQSSFAKQTVTVVSANFVAGTVTLVSAQSNGVLTFKADFASPIWSHSIVTGSFSVVGFSAGANYVVFVDRKAITVSGYLRITATNGANGRSATMDVMIAKDLVPFGGSLRIVDASGNVIAPATPLDSNTEYFCEALGWVADTIPTYEFVGSRVGTQTFSSSNRFNFRPFAGTADSSTIAVSVAVISPTFGDRIWTTSTLTINIGGYTLPSGVATYEVAAKLTLPMLMTASTNGDASLASSLVLQSLRILSLSTASGTVERINFKADLASALRTATDKVSVPPSDRAHLSELQRDTTVSRITPGLRSTVLDVCQTMITGPESERTERIVNDNIRSLRNTFSTPLQISTPDVTKTLSVVGSYLNSTETQTSISELKTVTQGLARSVASTYANFKDPFVAMTQDITLVVNKFAASVPKIEFNAVPDKSVRIEAPNGITGTDGLDFVDVFAVKFKKSYSPALNMSTSPVSIEVINGRTNQQVAVDGSVLFSVKFYGDESRNFTKGQACQYFDKTAGKWSTLGVVASNVESNVITCQTNHLTEFATFAGPEPTPPVIVGPSDLYYLFFLLLLIPLALVIIIFAFVILIYVFAKAKNGDLKPLTLPSFKNNSIRQGNSVGLEDLGI